MNSLGRQVPNMLLEISGEKQHPSVDVTGDGSKVQCGEEQYCTGTWNVRSTNQGKLEVVKQEMARVNIDILGISELKWIGMGEFSSDDHYIQYCGQESLRINGAAIMANKESKMQYLDHPHGVSYSEKFKMLYD